MFLIWAVATLTGTWVYSRIQRGRIDVPLSPHILQLHRIIRMRERAQKAITLCEYEGYCELHSLASFCYSEMYEEKWGFHQEKVEI